MRRARKNVQVGLGAASILMIFVILCMMVLSVLSFARAQQNDVSAIRERHYEQSYHQANTQAQIIYELLNESQMSNRSMHDLIKADSIQKHLQQKGVKYTLSNDILHLYIDVNDSQKLSIQLSKQENHIEKLCWKLVSTGGSNK